MSILAVYAVSLGATASLAGLAVGIYGIGQMFFRIPIGVVSDVVGRRREIIIFSLLVLAASDIGMALAGSPWHLVLFRLTTSIGASGYLVYAVLLAQQFMPERKGTAMGILAGVTSAGTLIGTWVGGQLAQVGGFKVPFVWGAVFAIIGIFFIMFVREKRIVSGSTLTARRFITIAFMPTVLIVSWTCVIGLLGQFGVTYTLLPLYASKILGFNKGMLGNLMTINLATNTIVALTSGIIADRIGRKVPTVVGLILLAATISLFPLAPSTGYLYLLSACVGASWGICYPSIMAMGLSTVEGPEQATAMGVFMAWYALGMYLGPQLSGLVIDYFGYSNSFFSLAAVVVLGVVLALIGIPAWLSKPKNT